MSDLDGSLGEFLEETDENFDQLDREFVAIEANPHDQANLVVIARTLHTLKGTCGFFGFAKLEALAHAGENRLQRFRDGSVHPDPDFVGAMLALVDTVRSILAQIRRTQEEGDADISALIERLVSLEVVPRPGESEGSSRLAEGVGDDQAVQRRSRVNAAETNGPSPGLTSATDADAITVRVGVRLLDRLMDMSGELVLARNQLGQFAARIDDPGFLSAFGSLSKISTELQGGVMKARMQPIGTLWDKFPRVVRDLARSCGKRVRITFEGRGTELDRTILEAIKDPFVHALRNAIDHGIEPPEDRVAAGKCAEGCLQLRARHEGGQIHIELSDDGAGIDPEVIRRAALRQGLLTREKLDRLADHELLRLIFLPGFSTAERVTSVSGRGVGMDVVQANVEQIGGTVEIRSRLGQGTSLVFTIPLTLAIIPSLIIGEGAGRYAIPQVAIKELVRVESTGGGQRIESFHGVPVYRLRGAILPLIELGREMGGAEGTFASDCDDVNIAVLRADGREFGLIVDRIFDIEEIVVKPLGSHLKAIPIYSGATILGDGRLALILDVPGLARRAGLAAIAHDAAATLAESAPAAAEPEADSTLLLFGLADRRMAVPINRVARLREIPASAVERADGQEVVQHNGQLIPLIRLGGAPAVALESDCGNDLIKVVICHDAGRHLGLAVDAIHDIVQTPMRLQRTGRQGGILGAVMIEGRTADLIDLPGLIRAADPTFFSGSEPVAALA